MRSELSTCAFDWAPLTQSSCALCSGEAHEVRGGVSFELQADSFTDVRKGTSFSSRNMILRGKERDEDGQVWKQPCLWYFSFLSWKKITPASEV